jgi:DNA-binding HxlR family transcriptional regulator
VESFAEEKILTPALKLKAKILQILVDAYPGELRFTDIYERAERPSKSVFSEALRSLIEEKLIIREQVTYRYVTYALNAEMYREKLKADRTRLEHSEQELEKKVNSKRREP